tara:strand:+ start:385 stop:510 length:126 start_codon:yes stop_codon:yes gene_type:complete
MKLQVSGKTGAIHGNDSFRFKASSATAAKKKKEDNHVLTKA